MKRFVIGVYVENKYGVLARISGMIMRKAFNIDSIASGMTNDDAFSRITITLRGEDYHCEQLINQLQKLHNVKNVAVLSRDDCVERELMLIKVKNSPVNRPEVMAATEVYRGKIIDYNPNTLCVEVTGEPSKINAFIDVMKPLGIIEIVRTGTVAMERSRVLAD
ncbi:MAG: acetolactate synthase small subunit [Clostridia bacterium]|nr:acetolactate synthase small subunit [Clostridia bacterium]MBR4955440.1 acetolactate synthase small subunit [Clostridia bacterium]MBR5902653.1 acetolactate synthase small subunit [Clostridia bacterium]